MCPAVDTYPVQWLVWPTDAADWLIVVGSVAMFVAMLVAVFRSFSRLPGGRRRWVTAALVICGALCASPTFYVGAVVQDHWDRASATYFNLDAPQMSAYLRLHGDGCLNQIVLAAQRSDREGEGLIALVVVGLAGFGLALIGMAMLFKRWSRMPAPAVDAS